MHDGATVRLKIHHVTRFDYTTPVTQGHSEIRKTPCDTALQRVIESDVRVNTKTPGYLSCHLDHFGNRVHYFNLLGPHKAVEIVAESVVETTNAPYVIQTDPDPDPRPCLERWAEFVAWSPGVPELNEYGSIPHRVALDMTPEAFMEALEAMADHFFGNFRYDPDATHVHSSPQVMFEQGGGVCQDMAHAMIGVLRLAKVPARYVSGYILDPKSDEEGQPLRGASATHAWVQAWHPQAGWIGIDPTNNKVADWQYTLMAVGRDYFDVQPVRGVFMGAGKQTLSVSVTVTREVSQN